MSAKLNSAVEQGPVLVSSDETAVVAGKASL
jgi:hypothetical protein